MPKPKRKRNKTLEPTVFIPNDQTESLIIDPYNTNEFDYINTKAEYNQTEYPDTRMDTDQSYKDKDSLSELQTLFGLDAISNRDKLIADDDQTTFLAPPSDIKSVTGLPMQSMGYNINPQIFNEDEHGVKLDIRDSKYTGDPTEQVRKYNDNPTRTAQQYQPHMGYAGLDDQDFRRSQVSGYNYHEEYAREMDYPQYRHNPSPQQPDYGNFHDLPVDNYQSRSPSPQYDEHLYYQEPEQQLQYQPSPRDDYHAVSNAIVNGTVGAAMATGIPIDSEPSKERRHKKKKKKKSKSKNRPSHRDEAGALEQALDEIASQVSATETEKLIAEVKEKKDLIRKLRYFERKHDYQMDANWQITDELMDIRANYDATIKDVRMGEAIKTMGKSTIFITNIAERSLEFFTPWGWIVKDIGKVVGQAVKNHELDEAFMEYYDENPQIIPSSPGARIGMSLAMNIGQVITTNIALRTSNSRFGMFGHDNDHALPSTDADNAGRTISNEPMKGPSRNWSDMVSDAGSASTVSTDGID